MSRQHDAPVLDTPRLTLRHISVEDAPFMVALLNDSSFIRNIGDRGVRTLDEARAYITTGPLASYEQRGFGLYLVELKPSKTPIGVCGLLKRDSLADVDIGFAFLPSFRSKGYALESALAVQTYARKVVGLRRLVAVTSTDNQNSIRVLERIGLRYETTVRLAEDGPELKLFASSWS
jgi:[ribosomal protein S5]-alanine N-acetyltransferase